MKWKFIISDPDGVTGTNDRRIARAAADDEETVVIDCEHGEVVVAASSEGHDVIDQPIPEQTIYKLTEHRR